MSFGRATCQGVLDDNTCGYNFPVVGQNCYGGLGSIDITAATHSVLVIGKSPQDPHIKVMAHSRSNLAPQGASIAFEKEDVKEKM